MVTLYHATKKPIGNGKMRKATRDPADFSDPNRRNAEELLDIMQTGDQSRLSSWFAFDKAEFAAVYLTIERNRLAPDQKPVEETGFIYAVEMTKFSRHPMILVDAIAKKVSTGNRQYADKLAAEYWNPTQNWKFWEYISPEIVFVERTSWPDPMLIEQAYLAYTISENATLKKFFESSASK